MSKKLFNLTQHSLTKEQLEELQKMGIEEILNLEDIFEENVVKKLKNNPSDENEMLDLAFHVLGVLKSYYLQNRELYIHLPIGSPYFMFLLSRLLTTYLTGSGIKVLFSHSERKAIEKPKEDGSIEITHIFKFQKFLVFYL